MVWMSLASSLTAGCSLSNDPIKASIHFGWRLQRGLKRSIMIEDLFSWRRASKDFMRYVVRLPFDPQRLSNATHRMPGELRMLEHADELRGLSQLQYLDHPVHSGSVLLTGSPKVVRLGFDIALLALRRSLDREASFVSLEEASFFFISFFDFAAFQPLERTSWTLLRPTAHH